jgi:hypothetical protein
MVLEEKSTPTVTLYSSWKVPWMYFLMSEVLPVPVWFLLIPESPTRMTLKLGAVYIIIIYNRYNNDDPIGNVVPTQKFNLGFKRCQETASADAGSAVAFGAHLEDIIVGQIDNRSIKVTGLSYSDCGIALRTSGGL